MMRRKQLLFDTLTKFFYNPSAMTQASGHLEEQNMNRIRLVIPVFIVLLVATPLFAQQQPTQLKSDQLTLDTVFSYRPKSLNGIQWQSDGKGYSMLEPSPG